MKKRIAYALLIIATVIWGFAFVAQKAAFITALYVVVVPLLSTVFGKKPSPNAIISIPIAIVGFYLLCIRPGVAFAISDLLVLLCALIFACHIIAVDRLSPGCDGVRMSCVQFITALLLNALAMPFEPMADPAQLLSALPSLLFLGVLSSGVAYTFQILGQKETDPTVSSLILSLESVFGVVGAAIVLGERMEIREYIGCGVVFLAVLLAQLDFDKIVKRIKEKSLKN